MTVFHNKSWMPLALAASISIAGVAHAEQEPIWDANQVTLVSEQLGDGTYAYYSSDAVDKAAKGLPIATSGGFIVGDDAVLMVDTMLNKRLYDQAEALIASATDLPIRYAVNTSFHGDHSYGNMYLPRDTVVIQHEVTQDYIQAHFAKDTQFMMQYFGAGRGIEEIRPSAADVLIPAGGKLRIDLGNKVVEIIDFGFAQTGGDLFVWEPNAGVMWTGNPIIAVKPSLPWLLDGHLLETLTSLQKVYDFLPDDATIVPGHGHAMAKTDLKWHLDYLNAVKTGVQAAIDAGLSLEETVAKVTLDEFRGYALFDWVHPGLNVPAAFKDLQP